MHILVYRKKVLLSLLGACRVKIGLDRVSFSKAMYIQNKWKVIQWNGIKKKE